MLYSYRSGKNRITPKAWHKLEAAEKAAGIGIDETLPAESAAKVNDSVPSDVEKITARMERMERELAKLLEDHPRSRKILHKGLLDSAEARGQEFFQSATHLAEWATKAAEGIADEGLAAELKFTSEEVARDAENVKGWFKTLIDMAREE